MYVKDHMTRNLFSVTPDTTISKALDIMKKNDFHRLPVIDEKGNLIGLITQGLIEEGSGANITSLSIYELNYLLSRTKVSDIMIRDVKTISEDVLVEEAAQKMMDEGISVLPVLDSVGCLTGIITEKDIFRALTDLMGYKKQGTRFIIACEDQPGVAVSITKLFSEHDANMIALAVYHSEERGTELVVKATGDISVESMSQIIVDHGFCLTDVVQTTVDGDVKHYPIPKKA